MENFQGFGVRGTTILGQRDLCCYGGFLCNWHPFIHSRGLMTRLVRFLENVFAKLQILLDE